MTDRGSEGPDHEADETNGRSWQEYLRRSEGEDELGGLEPEAVDLGPVEPEPAKPAEVEPEPGPPEQAVPPPFRSEVLESEPERGEPAAEAAVEPKPAEEPADGEEPAVPAPEPVLSSGSGEPEPTPEPAEEPSVAAAAGGFSPASGSSRTSFGSFESEADPRRKGILSGAVVLAAALVGLLLVPGRQGATEGTAAAAPSTTAGSEFFAGGDAAEVSGEDAAAGGERPVRTAGREAGSGPAAGAAGGASGGETDPAGGTAAAEAEPVPASPGRIEGPEVPEVDEPDVGTEATISLTSREGSAPALPPPPSGATPSEGPRWIPRDVDPEVANAEEVRELLLERYPRSLRRAGVGGSVTLWLFVNEEGRVTRVRVQQASPQEALNTAAEEVAREMIFRPARSGDRAIGVWVQQNLTFRAGG